VRALRLALVPAGIAFGVWAEWSAYEHGDAAVALADLAVGCVLVVCGGAAWELRPASRVGALMSLSGLAWFLGTAFTPALYLHRGPLVHLVLSYPTGRVAGVAAAVVAGAYVDAALTPVAEKDALTLVLSGAMIGTAAIAYRRTTGPLRTARRRALAAALAYGIVLALGAVGRVAGLDADRAVLWAYDVVIAGMVIMLFVDLLRGRWREPVVTGLVLDLGAAGDGSTLQATLARALGDPGLVLGYRMPDTGRLVDEAGLAVELPEPGSGRVVTPIGEAGDDAVLIHDEAVLADPGLVDAVAAAARIAVANARLQADARVRATQLEASRRRLVAAGDDQRRRIEVELRVGAERRLELVAAQLANARAAVSSDAASAIGELERDLEASRRELREFAHGVHPTVLAHGGLMPALALLVERSTLSVEVHGGVERLSDALEVTSFFVCSEALANAAKHAGATKVTVDVRADDDVLVLVVSDDGVGGADPSRGSGLRGLADRVEAHGGRMSVDGPAAGGTRIVAELPLS
jgi:signal transduction histidine kinase